LIRNHPKLGQGLTLEGWCLYLAFPTGTSHWDKHNLSQWDRQIRTSFACPVVGQTQLVPTGKKTARGLSLSHLGKRPLEAFLCPGTISIPTMELVPVPLSNLSQHVPQSWSTRPWKVFDNVLFFLGSFLAGFLPSFPSQI